jgi:hypothetical protein
MHEARRTPRSLLLAAVLGLWGCASDAGEVADAQGVPTCTADAQCVSTCTPDAVGPLSDASGAPECPGPYLVRGLLDFMPPPALLDQAVVAFALVETWYTGSGGGSAPVTTAELHGLVGNQAPFVICGDLPTSQAPPGAVSLFHVSATVDVAGDGKLDACVDYATVDEQFNGVLLDGAPTSNLILQLRPVSCDWTSIPWHPGH